MKKLLSLLLISALAISVTSCGKNDESAADNSSSQGDTSSVDSSNSDTESNTGDVVMKTDKESYPVDTETIKISLTNNTSEQIGYGLGYMIEHWDGSKWQKLDLQYAVVMMMAYIEPGETVEHDINLYQDQYEYETGKYRISYENELGLAGANAEFELV